MHWFLLFSSRSTSTLNSSPVKLWSPAPTVDRKDPMRITHGEGHARFATTKPPSILSPNLCCIKWRHVCFSFPPTNLFGRDSRDQMCFLVCCVWTYLSLSNAPSIVAPKNSTQDKSTRQLGYARTQKHADYFFPHDKVQKIQVKARAFQVQKTNGWELGIQASFCKTRKAPGIWALPTNWQKSASITRGNFWTGQWILCKFTFPFLTGSSSQEDTDKGRCGNSCYGSSRNGFRCVGEISWSVRSSHNSCARRTTSFETTLSTWFAVRQMESSFWAFPWRIRQGRDIAPVQLC